MPQFSVVLATRDRPALFKEALDSVIGQSFADFEIIVVNDGSSPELLAAYEAVYEGARGALGDRFKVFQLVHRTKGHGQSYSLNFGVDQSAAPFVCFLDDDDTWTDMGHLARAAAALSADTKADLYMANQKAFLLNVPVEGTVWLESLEGELHAKGIKPDAAGVYKLNMVDLLDTTGFCHLNCFTVRRALYTSIGGMDEGIRWECDHDLFLRLIDKARTMLFHPAFVSRHNVPDPSKTLNMTTAVSMVEKRLLQVRVYDKAALFSSNALIRAQARQQKAYALKKIATELADKKQWRSAASYAWEALGAGPGLKWLGFSLFCSLKALTS